MMNKVVSSIQFVYDVIEDKPTFGMPSQSIMFAILPMFAGKPSPIPWGSLFDADLGKGQITCGIAKNYIESILATKISENKTLGGKINKEESKIAFLQSPVVGVEAKIDESLFKDDFFCDENLAIYLKKTFGPEGLRHFLGFIIALEENNRKGYFYWNVNEHLKRLGLKTKKHGGYDIEAKKTAQRIFKLFINLFFIIQSKKGKKSGVAIDRLFIPSGVKFEMLSGVPTEGKNAILITANLKWYGNAMKSKKGSSAQYTKLLKKIAHINHRTHPHAIYLSTLLAVFWRIKKHVPRKLSVESLFDWCGLDASTGNSHRTDDLKKLENDIDFMVKEGHLGNWINNGENDYPSQCNDPFKCVITFERPNWFSTALKFNHKKVGEAING